MGRLVINYNVVGIILEIFIYYEDIKDFVGQVDQLEDRYLGMVEAASSNLALSTILLLSKRWPTAKKTSNFINVIHRVPYQTTGF